LHPHLRAPGCGVRHECEATVDVKNNTERRVAKDNFRSRLVGYSYRCLPDAVDPRGPKR